MKPNINVTPLIDVLLVLLVIFMVITPAKPSKFETMAPREPDRERPGKPNPNTLIVGLEPDGRLTLNKNPTPATTDTPEDVITVLKAIFEKRRLEGNIRHGTNEVETTVFINAPKAIDYGTVVRVVDAVKQSGAGPIGLQLDDLK